MSRFVVFSFQVELSALQVLSDETIISFAADAVKRALPKMRDEGQKEGQEDAMKMTIEICNKATA